MVDFLMQYGLFLAKTLTLVLAIVMVIAVVGAIAHRRRQHQQEGHVEVRSLNDRYQDMRNELEHAVLDEETLKQQIKAERKKEKAEAKVRKKAAKEGKLDELPERKRIYVLSFDGDMQASEVELLREEVTAVLSFARPEDEVVLKLESPGGVVHDYGFAASQLERIRRKQIPLTICVDRVAASGGYMMACIANKLIAAPFAVLGSIGVVAQLPNFHRLLKKNDIDVEVLTAGEYKRTLTVFGENTEKGREKFLEDLEDIHCLFKEFVSDYRPQLDLGLVATGEIWFGKRALQHQLVDELMTSDEYLFKCSENADLFEVRYEQRRGLQERLSELAVESSDKVLLRWWQRASQTRFFMR
ncbi:protease SohB [Nitrincola sp. MINF-07-Sa-05]|uniref:protease SohB n=1 Tax=Nitrincola salilacus TaxID=3400273 RepID=UPI003917C637